MRHVLESRRKFLKTAGMISAVACGLRAAPQKPNILFIITDDQHKNEFNFLPEGRAPGGEKRNLTPHIDRLSSEGIIFENQHVSTSVCTPSRFTCLTGQYASRAQNRRFLKVTSQLGQARVSWNTHITPSTPNVAKILQSAGYATGAVGKNHVIELPEGKIRKPHRKADPTDPAVDKMLKENHAAVVEEYKKCGFDFADSIYAHNIPGLACEALEVHNMDWVVAGAHKFIERYSKKPFFLYFATTITHGPFSGNAWKADPRATPAGLLKKAPEVMPPRSSIPKRLRKAGLTQKVADTTWLDDGVGSLLGKLEEKGVLDNTVIFYFNDHGVESGKGSLYEGGVETQCFVWGKKLKGRRSVKVLASNVDFAPTILDLCGVDRKKWSHMDGKSQVPVLNGTRSKVRDSLFFEIGCTRAVLMDGWKYIAFRLPDQLRTMPQESKKKKSGKTTDSRFTHICDRPGGRGSEKKAMQHYRHYYDPDQLYDLGSDPEEQNNLAGEKKYMSRLKKMKQELRKYIDTLPGGFGEFKA